MIKYINYFVFFYKNKFFKIYIYLLSDWSMELNIKLLDSWKIVEKEKSII